MVARHLHLGMVTEPGRVVRVVSSLAFVHTFASR